MVLAAGGGTRFSGPTHKLLAPLRGRIVVEWAVENARAAGLDETVVVSGAVDLRAEAERFDVTLLHNEDWRTGIASSLAVATAYAAMAGHDAVVVGLGDQPFVPAEAWTAVAAQRATPIAVATYDGRRGNPVRLAAGAWPLLPVDGDEGARVLMRRRPDLVSEVPCSGDPTDIDSQEDLDRWS